MDKTPADLIAEYNTLTTFDETESKRFAEHMKSTKARIEEIKNLLLATLNERNEKSVKTDFGTAYKSTIVTPKITDKIKFLDWALEDWDNRGAMLQIGAPQKAALDTYMDDNEGKLPPHVETSSFTRINIKAS